MKNILITGKGSFIGENIKTYLEKQNFFVEVFDIKNEPIDNIEFERFDTIIHVAAIVHSKEDLPWESYYSVNVELPVNIATEAKKYKVDHFIFFSSMAVFGEDKKLPAGNVLTNINKRVNSYYGKSKREAEKKLEELNDQKFKVSIVRPPSIYGPNCPGNYISTFVRIADRIKIFPEIYKESKQSFLHIDNLTKFIELLVIQPTELYFHPQDKTQISTVELLKIIAGYRNKKIIFTRLFNFIIKLFQNNSLVIKLFGGISYSSAISTHYDNIYQIKDVFDGFSYIKDDELI
ncbi:NAD-dependent epimerase/dehydratase family protein [Facklamia sp. DSM 111018]|uniref:NAD-dependent epimerase/dehydratase family protein n=1 Tax=Facklamia lactis TaxID=2749967 RepID=A0ABS0LMJ8_9LACT|nr:NAD-dependent epimerase/dehydratase family protein [Facklamia lactis]MBG9979935.1 NAD-dependent epimerase/dehydratase family protein [Facklamia lactis]MBG9985385.1 NAD-dependent epimerase/dehydratase family protein [Facklamia lactis]